MGGQGRVGKDRAEQVTEKFIVLQFIVQRSGGWRGQRWGVRCGTEGGGGLSDTAGGENRTGEKADTVAVGTTNDRRVQVAQLPSSINNTEAVCCMA